MTLLRKAQGRPCSAGYSAWSGPPGQAVQIHTQASGTSIPSISGTSGGKRQQLECAMHYISCYRNHVQVGAGSESVGAAGTDGHAVSSCIICRE